MNTVRPFNSPAPQRVLMTADTIGGVWTYALELIRAFAPYDVGFALATMGRSLTREQRREAGAVRHLELFESSYKLEWMEEPWADVAAAGEWLLELERQIGPDLVHLNGYAHGALAWRAPKLVVGHSCVLSWWRAVHGQTVPAAWSRYREAVAAGIQGADLVVAPSQAMLGALREHYGALRAARVIYNGRGLAHGKAQAKEPFVLTVGRLWDPAKNLSALAAIASRLPWPVQAAGEEQPPPNTGGHPGSSRSIRHLGRLSAGELLPWFARAALFVLPARYEPFGLAALEAALSGCALVLGDIPSLREIWGEAAVFVPPDDPERLHSVLTQLISQPGRIAELGARARQAASQYTPDAMASRYLLAYQDMLRTQRTDRKETLAVCES